MAKLDFGTVIVYDMEDQVEISFPYDKDFISFLKTLKGFYRSERQAWIVKSDLCGKSTFEIIEAVEAYFRANTPKKWPQIMNILRSSACVTSSFEVFCGLSGVRLTMPLSHPFHHHLKEVSGIENRKKTWTIPAKKFKDEMVQKALVRILKDDEKKFFQAIDPAEERGLVGTLNISRAEAETYGLKADNIVFADISLIAKIDAAMSDLPIREVPFEVVSIKFEGDRKAKVKLEYCTDDDVYAKLKKRIFGTDGPPALSLSLLGKEHDFVATRF